MRARECVPAPQPPPIIPAVVLGSSSASSASFNPYSALSAQLREHDLNMSANFQRLEQRVDNDLQYICASILYLQTCVDDTYSRNTWHVPLPRAHYQPLLTMGPPFNTWVPPSAAFEAPTPPEDPDFSGGLTPFVHDKKGGGDFMELSFGSNYLWELSWVFCFYLGCFYLGYFAFMLSLYLCIFGHVVFEVFGGHGHVFVTLQYLVDMYFVVRNLFWGWHEPPYGHIYFMIYLLFLGSYVSFSFCWYIWYNLLCVVCGIFVFLVFSLYSNHLPLVFGGWRLLHGWRKLFVHTPL